MNKEEQEEELRQILVNCLLASQIMIETLDLLKDSSFYQGKLKNVTKQFEIQITNICNKHIDTIWKCDDQSAMEAQNNIEEIAKLVCKMKPSQIKEILNKIENARTTN